MVCWKVQSELQVSSGSYNVCSSARVLLKEQISSVQATIACNKPENLVQ